MSKWSDARARLKATYPELHQFLVRLSSDADAYVEDRIERTIADYVEDQDPTDVRETIREIQEALKSRPVDYDELSDMGNYVLNSEDEAQAFLMQLHDGLKAALAARAQTRQ
ncbi:MAG TPA: contact-dependent growth inhibition system immunity protein [Dongiaceae bacterium]